MHTSQELVKETANVVSLPEIYLRLKQVIDDPQTGMADVADVLLRDPGLTASILRLANSALFVFASRVDTVSRAVTLLGPAQIHDLVLATTVTRAFDGVSEGVMNMDVFWQNSIYRAVFSRILAAQCDVLDSERLFIQGLLAEVGHLVMYHCLPEQCQAAIQEAEQSGVPLHQVESSMIGCNYAEVGAELLKEWQLPDSICTTVRQHVSPEGVDDFVLESSIVHIASQVALSADPDTPLTDRQCVSDSSAAVRVGLNEDACAQLCKDADKSAQEALSLIFPGQSQAG